MPQWVSIICVVLAMYILVSILLYYLQDYFFFKPEKLPDNFKFHYNNQEVDEYKVITRDGASLNGLHFKVKNPKGIVMYLKGNSRSIKGWGKFAVDFTRNGYDVIMMDYRGFGKSTGRRNQKSLKRDGQLVYNMIREKVAEKHIILYGRSLGSGLATKIASVNSPRMLILDAPYYSLTKVANRYMPFMPLSWLIKYPLPTYKWIRYVQCPIHIIHGTDDKLIPYKTSVKLSRIKPRLTKLHTVIGGGHKNLNIFESYHLMLKEILDFKPSKSSKEGSRLKLIHNTKRKNA